MLRALLLPAALLLAAPSFQQEPPRVELLRDAWGIPHVFASNEADGFYGLGWAAAEDRLLQMDLLRRRARGRLAEIFGEKWIDSDRKFRIAGIGPYCDAAAQALPPRMREYLVAFADGVNAWAGQESRKVQRRFARLGVLPEPWTPGDCICAWTGAAELFDRFVDESPVTAYHDFRRLASQIGEEEALKSGVQTIDDAAAVVPEAEMARDAAVYARLKARPPVPGFLRRSPAEGALRFSHAWAVGGSRSETGKPILESDPQTSVNNPPLWWEFHLSAGRFDVRGIGFPGAPAMLIGFNRHLAWGASALGAGSTVVFLEKLSEDGKGYLYRGEVLPFERRAETIQVKGGQPVAQEVLTNRHGFVINSLMRQTQPGEAYVSHYRPLQVRATSLRALLGMMAARDWSEFREAMRYYYSPGLHIVYADAAGNIGYQTLVHVPLTRRTPRMALEGWTGEDEIQGRVPLDEMPHMLNPAAGFISHANNLPVGSWYPYDLGIGTGGVGHTSRSMRLVELLQGERQFSLESFETEVHRDDMQAAIAALFPVARKVAEEDGLNEAAGLLHALEGWNLRYRSAEPHHAAARALAANLLLPFRRSGLGDRVGGGEGGICHLARLLAEQFAESGQTPKDAQVRAYLLSWLRAAAEAFRRPSREDRHSMPYQANGPLGFPPLDSEFDLVSPPLSCLEAGTIWSQAGNSYTQIVDLADVDSSRSLLPPGISEDPESPHHAGQMDLWARGGTHPAPLSRRRIEELGATGAVLEVRRPRRPIDRREKGDRGN